MNITFGGGQTALINVYRMNQSIARRNNNHSSEQLSKAERGDSVTISPQGKKNSLLDSLMKQKEKINEQKNSLISSTLENGGTLDTIKSQLKSYDEQMKSIDDQIAEMMTKEMEKQAKKLENQGDSKPKTEKEIQQERLANLTSLSSDLKQSKVVNSVQAKVNSSARVLKSEIELDKGYGGSLAKGMITKKEVALEDMEQKSLNLSSKIMEKLSDVSAKIDKVNKPQEILPDREEESKIEELYSPDEPFLDISKNENSKKILE